MSHRQHWFTCQISKGKVGQEESLRYYKSRLDFGGAHTVGRQKVKRLRDNFFVVDPWKIFQDGRRHSGWPGPASWRRFAPRYFRKFYQSDLLKNRLVSFFWFHPGRRDCHWVTYLIYFFLLDMIHPWISRPVKRSKPVHEIIALRWSSSSSRI